MMVGEMKTTETIVVGCGVAGLTSGIRLLENQFPVKIIARDFPPHTTSNVAAAIWYPYRAHPIDRVLKWGRLTIEKFYELVRVPGSGVHTVELIELFGQPMLDPWWKDAVRVFRHTTIDELPPGYQDGYFIEVPLIETPIYMEYLMARFQELGGQVERKTISKLSNLYRESRLIVNCTGVGARAIIGDIEVYPIRGQIVRVKATNIQRCLIDEAGKLALTYIIPRSHDCILGGTAEENNWHLEVDLETSQEILRKCKQLVPTLENAEILEHMVGLRPGRKEVRLEVEQVSERCTVIHNYGHGGAGFTLSWGCAEEVAELAQRAKVSFKP